LKISANAESVETWKIMKFSFCTPREIWTTGNFKVHKHHKTWKCKKPENTEIPRSIKTNLLNINTPSVTQCNTGNLQSPEQLLVNGN
jgi:hypothetical protein